MFTNTISMSINNFGGEWTEHKIQILENYARGFLNVFKNKPFSKLLYFDGFAGSGEILSKSGEKIEGAALRIMKLETDRKFDLYYFVEKNQNYKKELEEAIARNLPNRNDYHVVCDDCNEKLYSMVTSFLDTPRGKNFKVLAFIDPKGMQLNWSSIEILKDKPIDLWILSPTGGTNRLLKRDGKIEESWLNRLSMFLGISHEEIKDHFYSELSQASLFGDIETRLIKQSNAIRRLHDLYVERLGSIFKFITEPYVLRNKSNSVMFHFFMATNNQIAKRIADSVIKPKYKM